LELRANETNDIQKCDTRICYFFPSSVEYDLNPKTHDEKLLNIFSLYLAIVSMVDCLGACEAEKLKSNLHLRDFKMCRVYFDERRRIIDFKK